MLMLGVYLLILTALIALIIEVFVRVFSYKGKRENLNIQANDALCKMLSLRGVDLESEEIQIVESKRHSYHPIKNTIRIRKFELMTVFDHILSLHEGGHYLSTNQNNQKHKRFVFTLSIIGINRIIIIPIFIFVAFIFDGENSHFLTGAIPLTVVLIFFVIASTLRFSIGMSEEYHASRIALEYIEQHYDKSVEKYAKRLLLACFYQQLFQALFMTIAVLLIYYMVLFIT